MTNPPQLVRRIDLMPVTASHGAAIAALEHARRVMIAWIRQSQDVSPAELIKLLGAIEELTSLGAGLREVAAGGVPHSRVVPESRSADYIRMALHSALEALSRGEVGRARRRAELAKWAAGGAPEHADSWFLTALLEIVTLPDRAGREEP